MKIEAVPETITRSDYIRLIESLGFSADNLVELHLYHDCIMARVYSTDTEGERFLSEENRPALNTVWVRVE